jgi:hypothetical protein
MPLHTKIADLFRSKNKTLAEDPDQEYLTPEQIAYAIKTLKNFEEMREQAPSARRLLEEMALLDYTFKKTIPLDYKKCDKLVAELIRKLNAKGVKTDDVESI